MPFACKRTYATLCIYADSKKDHFAISDYLGIAPTRVSHKSNIHGWFLSTEDKIQSTDVNVHLVALLELLEPKRDSFLVLGKCGYKIRIFSFWESLAGNGGPFLIPDVMKRLADLDLELHFDIWLDLPEQ